MPRKKNRSKKYSRPDEEFDEDNQEEAAIQDPLFIEMMEAKHPFELVDDRKEKQLTVLQRIITFFIQRSGGYAHEDKILDFLNQHWKLINDNLPRPFYESPTIRMLHIAFAAKKSGRHLFVKSAVMDGCWMCNSYEECKSSLLFEDLVISVIASKGPLTINELEQYVKGHEHDEGLFPMLPISNRIRACLIAKKSHGIVSKNEDTGKWILLDREQSQSNKNPINLPSALDGVSIKNLTVDQLWLILKGAGVY